MFATMHTFRRRMGEETPQWGAALATALHGGDALGSCTLADLGGSEGAVVAFWPTEDAATTAASRSTSDVGGGTRYRVVDSQPGRAHTAPPGFAQRTRFDGPRSPEVVDAGARAGRERIWPAVKDIAGIVGVHVLLDDDDGAVVLGFATDVEALHAVQRAIFATQLLPGEDPALLPGPDRVSIDRVLAADLSVLARVVVPS